MDNKSKHIKQPNKTILVFVVLLALVVYVLGMATGLLIHQQKPHNIITEYVTEH